MFCSVTFQYRDGVNNWKFIAIDGNKRREKEGFPSLEMAFKEAQDYFGRNKENDVDDS